MILKNLLMTKLTNNYETIDIILYYIM